MVIHVRDLILNFILMNYNRNEKGNAIAGFTVASGYWRQRQRGDIFRPQCHISR